jgi:hypothetical protein
MLRSWVRRAAERAVLLLLAGVGAGCGKSEVTVSGKVTHKGKAVTTGEVLFLSEDGRVTHGPVGADGTYTARGVPVGPAKVGVDNPPPAPPSTPGLPPTKDAANDPEMKELKERAARYVPTPSRYRDPKQSGLTYTVRPGSQTHDIDLP